MSKEDILKAEDVKAKLDVVVDKVFAFGLLKPRKSRDSGKKAAKDRQPDKLVRSVELTR